MPGASAPHNMTRPLYRPLLAGALALASATGHAGLQDRSIHAIADATLRDELLQLGGYQELVQEIRPGTLRPVPLVKATDLGLEFRDGELRVQVEALPFSPATPPRRDARGWSLEGRTILGWTPGAAHTRLARLELVQRGMVCGPAYATWRDVCDTPLLQQGVPYAAVMRSPDGRRTYLHLQAGEGADGRMITWVFADGRLLCRIVDPAPLW